MPSPMPNLITGKDLSSNNHGYRPPGSDDFLFVKATEGHTYHNPDHDHQVSLGRKSGMVIGHYMVIREGGGVPAQVDHFLKWAKAKPGDALIVDWEQWYDSRGRPLPKVTVAEKNQAITLLHQKAPGHRVLLYCNRSWWNTSDKKAGDGLWLAEYGVTEPKVDDWLFWQWTNRPVDQNVARFKSKAALRKWATDVPAPGSNARPTPALPAAATVTTTLKGTVLDLAAVPTGGGTRHKFRDRLTNTSGAYPGCVCDCIPRWVALVEALAKEAGLPIPAQFWEGSFVVTPNSGKTHQGGGALDIKTTGMTKKQKRAWVKICRLAGAAAWLRNWAHGRFDTEHIHVELIGCPHASADARAQWADYKAGRDGLAYHGRDYGPKVAYITAEQAFKQLTRTRTGATPADSKDWLEMATKKEVQDAVAAALKQSLTGDLYPSPSLNPDSVKKNPKWTWPSMVYWAVKLTSLIRRDMPTRKQVDRLIGAVEALAAALKEK
jgi:hypothetical protein